MVGGDGSKHTNIHTHLTQMPLLASSVHQLEEKVNYRLLSLCIKRHTGHKLSRRVSVYAPIVSSTFCGSGYECFHSVIKLSTRPVLESIPKAVFKERMYNFDQQSNELRFMSMGSHAVRSICTAH